MRKPNLFILTAWAFHVASWFLPVLKAQDYHEVVVGWRAFRLATCGVLPCEGIQFETLHHAVLATISVITTLLFLCSPLVVLRGSRVLQKSAAWVAAAAFAVNIHWIFIFGEKRSELTIGYFLWWLWFLLLAIGLFASSNGRRKEAQLIEHLTSR